MRSRLLKSYIMILAICLGVLAGCTGPAPHNEVEEKGGSSTSGMQTTVSNDEVMPEESQQPVTADSKGRLRIHFIDVGQADSILVETPNSKIMLIDAGNNDDGNTVTAYLKSQGVKRIDILIGTHPHEDHIGGMDNVIYSFDIGKVYMPKASSTTKTFDDVLKAIKSKGLKIATAAGGVKLDFDNAVKAEILAPNGSGYEDLNNYSAVVKLTYGNTAFLLTGDAEAVSEREMLARNYDLRADVLKLGHHGSSSSTSNEFLDSVKPRFAIIMAGKGNDYGHPHKETMAKLKSRNIPVYRTDENGTIIVESDGSKIVVNTDPGDYSYGSSSGKASSSEGQVGSGEKLYVDANGNGLIKGNINSKNEKIYHLPGGAYYDKTDPEVWFKTESEAQAAGYRKSSR